MEHENAWDRWLGYGKIIDFLVLALAAIALLRSPNRLWVLLIPATVFLWLIVFHERVLRRIRRLRRIGTFYEKGIARLENRWAGSGESGIQFMEAVHPYARDLDLFGQGSLFELLCLTRTRAGEATLADWLLHPATPDVVGSRHEAILETKDQLRLRECLFVAGESAEPGVRPEALASWGEQEPLFRGFWMLLVPILTGLWVAAALYFLFSLGNWYPLLGISLLNRAVGFFVYPRVEMEATAIERATDGLQVFTSGRGRGRIV